LLFCRFCGVCAVHRFFPFSQPSFSVLKFPSSPPSNLSRSKSKEQDVVNVKSWCGLVMKRESFSLGRQALARRRTLIPSTLREMEGLQGQQPCVRFFSKKNV
jgi:hypothetical protein